MGNPFRNEWEGGEGGGVVWNRTAGFNQEGRGGVIEHVSFFSTDVWT